LKNKDQMHNKVFTGDRDLDNLESDEENINTIELNAPEFMNKAPKGPSKQENEE